MKTPLLQLMRIATGNATQFNSLLSANEWRELLCLSIKHGVVGIAFSAIEKLPKEQVPPLDILMEWSAFVDYKEKKNRLLNSVSVQMCRMLESDGKRACIIKGASVGTLYPDPLRRDAGDVDVWMAGGYDTVSEYVRQRFQHSAGDSSGHHISVTLGKVQVEVHFVPAELYSRRHNRYLHTYYKAIEERPWNRRASLDAGAITVPEPDTSLVIVIVHMFHHWAFEGIGMKHVMDCYWLLKHVGSAAPQEAEEAKAAAMRVFKQVGITAFVAALMYVMQQIGMDEADMLCAPNAKQGKRLLSDILATGLVTSHELAAGTYSHESKPHKFFRRLRRIIKMMPMAPTEMPHVLANNVRGVCGYLFTPSD